MKAATLLSVFALAGCSGLFPKGASYEEAERVSRDVCAPDMRYLECFDAVRAHARSLEYGVMHAQAEAEWKCPSEMRASECFARLEGRGK